MMQTAITFSRCYSDNTRNGCIQCPLQFVSNNLRCIGK